MYSFGSGVLIGARTDIINATPVNFGLVQEVTIDETASVKELYGQFQHPIALARGTIKTTGKAKVARISGLAFASLFYGVTPVAGQVATAFAEVASVPAASPYMVTPANTTAPAVGQYTLAAGVYGFNAGDSGKALLLNYTYTIATTGQRFTVTNQLTGTTPTFAAQFITTFQGQEVSLKLNACTANKLAFQTKLEDFVLPKFDFAPLEREDFAFSTHPAARIDEVCVTRVVLPSVVHTRLRSCMWSWPPR